MNKTLIMSEVILLEDDSSDELKAVSNVVTVAKDAEPASDVNEKSVKEVSAVDKKNDVTDVDTAENSNEDEERPLLDLMKHLINYNGKQNSKLTNNQLIGILQQEFELDVANLHFISVDIYMNVLKKFLKDWPQWDEFDQVMHETRCMNDNVEVEKMLEREYQTLKNYLAAILKVSEPFAREAAQKLKRSEELPESSRAVPGDVVMEINCTRDQLNTLFFRKPHPEFKNTIFNINCSIPSKISLTPITLESILSSCYINLTISMACFKYKRELTHNFKHVLVNKKLQHLKRDPPLNTFLQMQKTTKTDSLIDKKDLKQIIEKIQRVNQYDTALQSDVATMLKIVQEDFNVFLPGKAIDIPCSYRHYLSCYPYVRYLYKDVEAQSEKYDLQLEEKASPMLKFHISRLSITANALTTDVSWLKLECSVCQLKFQGVAGIESLKTHFRECHLNEPNWCCVRCDREFRAVELSAARWYHECECTDNEIETTS